MTAHAQIEASQAVSRKTVATTLENDGLRTVPLHNTPDDRFEDALVRKIIDAVTQREVDSIVLSLADSNIAQFTGTGEIFSIFVKRDRHHAVRSVESLLDTVTVMNINVNVQDTLPESQKFQDSKDNVCGCQ